MDKKTLSMLMKGVFGKKVPAEFAKEDYDYEAALREEISTIAGTRSDYNRNKYDIFEIFAQELDEQLPAKVLPLLAPFADFIQVPNGTRLEFTVKRGKNRARQFVTRATESGYYETFRLDRDRIEVYPVAIGGAGYIDFERYLSGIDSLVDIYSVIVEGITEEIFLMVQEALLASWNNTGRPAANKVAATEFDAEAMLDLCNTVRAYGSPVIYTTPQFAGQMTNAIEFKTEVKIPDADVDDIREYGYIGRFRGVPVIVLPNSFTDDSNTKLALNPSFAYVIPAGKEKLLKVGMEGDSYFDEFKNRDNSIVVQGYKKVGVAMVGTPNYWGIYYNSGIDAHGWDEYNTDLLGSEMP